MWRRLYQFSAKANMEPKNTRLEKDKSTNQQYFGSILVFRRVCFQLAMVVRFQLSRGPIAVRDFLSSEVFSKSPQLFL